MKVPTIRRPDVGNAARRLVVAKKPRKPMAALADAEDPLDEEKYPADPEGADKTELSQLRTGFMQRAKQEAERFRTATATDYYTVLVFDDGAQCTAFLRAVGMHNERSGDLYIDGRLLADQLGIKLPEARTVFNATPRIDAKLKALVRKP